MTGLGILCHQCCFGENMTNITKLTDLIRPIIQVDGRISKLKAGLAFCSVDKCADHHTREVLLFKTYHFEHGTA